MTKNEFPSVWDALEDDPAVAANMKMRASLAIAIERQVAIWDVTQGDAAGRVGLTQPRMNDLLRGKIDKFSLDALVEIATRAGLSVQMKIASAA